MIIRLTVGLLIFCSLINANMTKEGFERFFNYYFVETGTNSGDGVNFALRAGFPEIISIEIRQEAFAIVRDQFSRNKNVTIILGDSGQVLYDAIKDLNKPITFWLDGHIGEPTPGCVKYTPLFEELEQIKRHQIKHHTIIIDDMLCCNGILFDYHTKQDIIEKIKEINVNYIITYVDGGDDAEVKDNIMVAYVPFCNWEK